jgi:hypothetical protein
MSNSWVRFCGVSTAVLLCVGSLRANPPEVPRPAAVLGYELGERVTDYAGMERYFSRLAEASPRVAYASYGEDYENRTLRYVVVSSAANIEQLDAIQAATDRLTDPHLLDAAAASALIETTPLVIWLNYSTDGNETAGLESAIEMAHRLATADDPETVSVLEQAVIVITPIMSPSSHERWASWSNSFAAGPAGNDDPLAMEHNPPWGVLTNNNHYLVDLNRESVWATQRESAAIQKLYYEWNPAVFVDHHGEYDNFTGPGYEEPLNPLFTAAQRRWLDRFGQAIGHSFAERGWSYSPWETGSFYPGYWESFGSLNGAVGFTYETIGGGSKGLRYRRDDGSVITLKQAAEQHTQASLAVIETAVAAKSELMEDFAAYWRSALELPRTSTEKAFLVDPGPDPARANELVRVLLANQVEVSRTTSDGKALGVHDYFGGRWKEKSFAAGTYVVPVGQPRGRLVLTMMRKHFTLPEETLQEAEVFRRNREDATFRNAALPGSGSLFYDITAWSMPLTYHVPAYWVEGPFSGSLAQVTVAVEPEDAPISAPGEYGYVYSNSRDRSTALTVDLLQQDVVLNVASTSFTIEGGSYPRGSVLIRNERNPGRDLLSILSQASQRHGVPIHPLDSTYSEQGPSVGSDHFVFIRRPKVAVLAGDPVSTRSFGDLWYILERLYGLTFTAISKEQLDEEALIQYDVFVLPDGWYGASTFTEEWIASLKSWVSRGGTLVCLRRASRWAADEKRGLASARMRPAMWPAEATEGVTQRKAVSIPGAILKSLPDEHHFLTLGYENTAPVLVSSNLAFEPESDLASPFTFAARDELLLSGFAYPDSLDRLEKTPYVIAERLGSGHIILFLDDPNFRVYWRGLARLFMNSILLSPSF